MVVILTEQIIKIIIDKLIEKGLDNVLNKITPKQIKEIWDELDKEVSKTEKYNDDLIKVEAHLIE